MPLSPFQRFLLRLRGASNTPKWAIDAFFGTAGWLTGLAYLRWRLALPPAFRGRPLKVHLGSGPVYLPGWVNIEGLPVWRCDLWLDVRWGLPFADGSVKAIYANQVLEHFDEPRLRQLLSECHRVLAAGGHARFVVPSLDLAAAAIVRGDLGFFERAHISISRGPGALARAAQDYLLCSHHHRVFFDEERLRSLLEDAGPWADIRRLRTGDESGVLNPEESALAEIVWGDIASTNLVVEVTR